MPEEIQVKFNAIKRLYIEDMNLRKGTHKEDKKGNKKEKEFNLEFSCSRVIFCDMLSIKISYSTSLYFGTKCSTPLKRSYFDHHEHLGLSFYHEQTFAVSPQHFQSYVWS